MKIKFIKRKKKTQRKKQKKKQLSVSLCSETLICKRRGESYNDLPMLLKVLLNSKNIIVCFVDIIFLV